MGAALRSKSEPLDWVVAPEWAWLLDHDPETVVFTLVEDDGTPAPPRHARDGWAEAAAAIAIEEADDPERDAWLAFDDDLDDA